MAGSEKRYCAKGEQCTQYAFLGGPSKLSVSNKSPICDACLKAEADAESERACAYPRGRVASIHPVARDTVKSRSLVFGAWIWTAPIQKRIHWHLCSFYGLPEVTRGHGSKPTQFYKTFYIVEGTLTFPF